MKCLSVFGYQNKRGKYFLKLTEYKTTINNIKIYILLNNHFITKQKKMKMQEVTKFFIKQ